ncbi:MAG: hypothetical protein AAF202_01445, partial [Pseudomonadota bacterium]
MKAQRAMDMLRGLVVIVLALLSIQSIANETQAQMGIGFYEPQASDLDPSRCQFDGRVFRDHSRGSCVWSYRDARSLVVCPERRSYEEIRENYSTVQTRHFCPQLNPDNSADQAIMR